MAVGSEHLHELVEAVLQIEYGRDDGKWRCRDEAPCVGWQNGGEVDRYSAGPSAIKDGAGADRVATPHVQAQRKIDRVREHDEIGDSEHEDRESGAPNIGDGQHDPSRQQHAYRERREKRPCPERFHAVAAPSDAAAGRIAGSRAYNSDQTSLSSAMY